MFATLGITLLDIIDLTFLRLGRERAYARRRVRDQLQTSPSSVLTLSVIRYNEALSVLKDHLGVSNFSNQTSPIELS